LATAFGQRCLDSCSIGGTVSLVSPQNWLFQSSYKNHRKKLLTEFQWDFLARLGPGAFETITGHVVNVALFILSARVPKKHHALVGIDVSCASSPENKSASLCRGSPDSFRHVSQAGQLTNPDHRILLEFSDQPSLLQDFAQALAGINTGDYPRWGRNWWELSSLAVDWVYQQSTTSESALYSGLTNAFRWCNGGGDYRAYVDALDGRLGGSWKRRRLMGRPRCSGDSDE
jgi:hypothetical protein